MEDLLAPEVQAFITASLKENIKDLAFMKNPFTHIPWQTLLQQIHAKQKAAQKLPTWYHAANILFPSAVSIEQTSSELTAAYKASLIEGNSLIDLTGGFGVDDYYFAKRFKAVVHCEYLDDLSTIVAHNYEVLGITNVQCCSGDSLETLKQLQQSFDWIYIDPARRSEHQQKVFFLKDCQPDVLSNLETYFLYTQKLLIKTSPLLDITATLKDLKYVRKLHIIALNNEVKELLWEVEKDYCEAISVVATHITKDTIETVESIYGAPTAAVYGLPNTYLYVPNAAIMKSGNYDNLCNTYGVQKLHKHSHLFTAAEKIEFPGRSFKIEQLIPYTKNEMKALTKTKANVAIRNFPLNVDALNKKYKFENGGDKYYFFTTLSNEDKVVLLCTKA